ncbi:hypothetical protein [Rhodococcus sp. KBS0724]|uniref:hypothetical protein n=1 Tax=Rhodococcus sp. KBS0724 TaxID=1179674 RepID=UPI00163D5071|nr:hypothetical protein [Rhodococcus sp. KBS0724]
MIVIGIDTHKRTHTAVATDQAWLQLSTKTVGTTSKDHFALLQWARRENDDRIWAIEDCRHLSRRLKLDLLDLIAAGERVVRVPL